MPYCIRGEPRAQRDRFDEMRLNLHRSGRGRPCRELRIESADDAIRTLRRKRRSRVEESEVARMRHVHDAVLELCDAPREQFIKGPRRAKVEGCKLAFEGGEIKSRYDGSLRDACIGARQLTGEKIIQARALGSRREQSRRRCLRLQVVG